LFWIWIGRTTRAELIGTGIYSTKAESMSHLSSILCFKLAVSYGIPIKCDPLSLYLQLCYQLAVSYGISIKCD